MQAAAASPPARRRWRRCPSPPATVWRPRRRPDVPEGGRSLRGGGRRHECRRPAVPPRQLRPRLPLPLHPHARQQALLGAASRVRRPRVRRRGALRGQLRRRRPGPLQLGVPSVAAARGCVVVGNSSAFRKDPEVPLVIPEVNPEAMAYVKLGSGRGALIANPSCSTIICLMAATPLHRQAKVKRMIVSTYQAASGAFAAAMETREVLDGRPPTCHIFKQQYAFNLLFSHNAPIFPNWCNEEEMKLVKETRKIWNDEDVKVTATCIRVPVMRAHAESVNLQFERPLD